MRQLRGVFLQAAGVDWVGKLIGSFKVLKEYFACVVDYFFYMLEQEKRI